jgi:predicted DNA binding CopG/RHH family protein
MKKKIKFLDDEEKEIIESFERDEWISDFDDSIKKKYQEYAAYSLNKQKRINIRMTERDLHRIKIRAIQEGIPYQSLISMLIHKFNEGKIKIKS